LTDACKCVQRLIVKRLGVTGQMTDKGIGGESGPLCRRISVLGGEKYSLSRDNSRKIRVVRAVEVVSSWVVVVSFGESQEVQ
jgi:hypothetical protein